jgi:flagellar hook-length control protein FliK
MNQLATMLDTDLTVDARARTARTGTDAESGADFGQVLQGISKPDEASVSTEQAGRNSRHSKKGNIDGLLNVSADPVVSTVPMTRPVTTEVLDGQNDAPGDTTLVEQRGDSLITSTAAGGGATALEAPTTALQAPTTAFEAITSEPASSNATVVNGAAAPAAPGAAAAGASVTATSSAAVSGQALRISLSRGEEMTRTSTATDALKPVHSVPVEALDGSGRTNGKAVGSLAGPNGTGLPATTAVAAAASGISKLSGGDVGRLGTTQHKLLASLEAKGLDARPTAVSIGDPTTWSIGAATREDPTSVLRQSVAPEATLTSPMGSEEWQMDLGTQLVAMIEKGDQSAVINLSPVELGPVQIDVTVHEGEVSVAFAAQVADTRSAIEGSLSRLREMLAGEGLSLTNSNINNILPGFSQQKSPSRGGEDRPSQRGRFADPENAIVVQTTPNRIRRSLVDLYA